MTLNDAMQSACAEIGINVPRNPQPGRWVPSAVIGKAANNTSGRVLIFDDMKGGIAHNWATGQQSRFRIRADHSRIASPRDLAAQRARERQREAERREVEHICGYLVSKAEPSQHDYLERKGFPDEMGLILDRPADLLPDDDLGKRIAAAIPKTDGPLLIVPGRIGKRITTVQFIAADGSKKNILGGQMGGASHRIATGRETWVCEGIATALSVRAALRILGRSATVLCAFSAHNVGRVASQIKGAIIAADHDKPVGNFGGLGTGEYYARQAGCRWIQPPALGDFNDMHEAEGLRAVAMLLRGVAMA